MRQICLLLGCLFIGAMASAQSTVIDKVVAIVGGEIVLLSDIEEQHALLEAQGTALPEDARCRIFEQLLVNKLLLNQAKLDSVLITDEEVEAQLDARIERILAYMNGDISQFEDYYGQSVNEVKAEFRADLEAQILSERMRDQVMAGTTVTPSEVKQFFAQIPTDSLPYFNSEVEIGEIVYLPPVNAEERAKAIAKLEDIRRQIVDEEADFAELALKHSADGSARAGGDLGWAKRGKFVPEFEAAAYNLDPGQVSEVTETEFGFHLIQLLERRGNSIHVRHILIRPEITDNDLLLAREHLDSIRQLITMDSITFSLAVKKFGEEQVQSYNNDGRVVNPATGNTFFEIGDLDPDIYFTIDTMEVDKVSAPFEFSSPTGEVMYRLVKLQSRSDPHVANLQQDYSKIQQAAVQSKQNEHINEWVTERIEGTYIQIDPRYFGCANLETWRKEKP